MGRPSRYNALVANTILERLVGGESILEIARDSDMPGERTIYSWLATKPEFQQNYARVTEIRAHLYAERQLLVSLEAYDKDSAAASRVKAEAYRWMSARMLPRVYGDKMLHTGADGEGPIQHKLALDYGRFNPQQKAQFLALLEIAMGPQDGGAPMIEGEATEETE